MSGVLSQGPDAPVAVEDPSLADGHHLARGAAANILILAAANFRGIFTFLIARLLGEAALGRFGLVFMTMEVVSKLGTLGLDGGIVPTMAARGAAGDGDSCRLLFRRATLLALAASAVVTALVLIPVPWAFAQIGSDAFAHGGTFMLLALPGVAIARISTATSWSLHAMRNEFYSRGLTETWVTTGVFLAAFAFGFREQAPALAVLCGVTVAALVACLLAKRAVDRLPHGKHPASVPDAVSLVRFSMPTAGSNLLNVLVTQADVLLLMFYVGRVPGVTIENVGIFWMCAEIAVGFRKVRQVFEPMLAPVVATRVASEERAALRQTMAGPGRWVFSAQLPLVGVCLLSSGAILSIYGAGFREGALWLAMLGVAHGTNTFAGLVETLFMVERPLLNFVNAAVTVGVQIIAGMLLIPQLGVTGAALAMCLGFALQGLLRFLEVRHVFGWSWPWGSLKRPLLAFAVAFLPAALLRMSTDGIVMEAVAGGLFVLLYAASWWQLGAEPSDREVWRRLRAARASSQ